MKLSKNLMFLLALFMIGVYIYPITIGPILHRAGGINDWDLIEQKYWAIYKTIWEYRQIPGNNPWIGGGIPLLNSSLGLFGIFSIIFGAFIGLRIAIILYFILGLVGLVKLIEFYKFTKFQQYTLSLYILFSNALMWHLYGGHIIFVNLLTLPLLIYFLLNYQKKYYGLLFGILFSIAFCDNVVYTFQYILIILIFFSIYIFFDGVLKKNKFNNRKKFYIFLLTASLSIISYCLFQISNLIDILSDFPRVVPRGLLDNKLSSIISVSFLPYLNFQTGVFNQKYCADIPEVGNYLGGVMALIFAVFLVRKRIYYILPFIFVLFCFSGDYYFYQFNYILKLIPSFSSQLCTGRLRLLCPYIFVGFLLYAIKNKHLLLPQRFLNLLLSLIVIDVFIFAIIPLYKMPVSPLINVSAVAGSEFLNYRNLPIKLDDKKILNSVSSATLSNIGIISSSDSNLPNNGISIGKESSNYLAEFTQDGKIVNPIMWSPNRIILKSIGNGCINTNILASNHWKVNSSFLYSNYKVLDFKETMCVYGDKNGYIDIIWEHKNFYFKLLISILSALALIFILRWSNTAYEL